MNGKDARSYQRLVSLRRPVGIYTRTTDDSGVTLDRPPDWNHTRDIGEVAFPIEEDDVSEPDS
jgi:hypothetical protein